MAEMKLETQKRFLRTAITHWFAVGLIVATSSVLQAADWPMWRSDARRSASSPDELPAQMQLQWTRQLGTPIPAWPQEQDYHGKLEFDRSYQAIVLGKRVIVPSMTSDRVTAYDSDTGDELWRFYADAPVRFAPAGADDRIYFVADDGHLYCLAAADGRLQWKVRGGPNARAIWGNGRLISTWPARGAPVVADGTVYFAAGIWPFMGIFIHAVDAATGDLVWTNSGTGAIYNLHQHGGAEAFGGVAPQGYTAVEGDRLVVAGGLTVPAVFDRATGEFLHFEQSHAAVGKGAGGFDVAAQGDLYFNNGKVYNLSNGKQLLSLDSPLLTGDRILGLDRGELVVFAANVEEQQVEVTDSRGKVKKEKRYALARLQKSELPIEVDRLLLQAGSRIYAAAAQGGVVALEWSEQDASVHLGWHGQVPGTVRNVLSADNKLYVVTDEGDLFCFGAGTADAVAEREPVEHRLPMASAEPAADSAGPYVETILRETGQNAGIALVWGLESGQLVDELLRQSELHVIAVDPDQERVAQLRRRLDDAQRYGQRVHVLCAPPQQFAFPPYLANLVVSERLERAGWSGKAAEDTVFLKRLFHALRPYGGTACLPVPAAQQAAFAELVEAAELPNGQVSGVGELVTLTRAGALPGAGQWTHQYGSSANTVFSADEHVRAPLGLLWFGGPTNRHALPRHAQGPIPHVVAGRLIIEGVDSLSARCVYTGRTLWVREFPDIGFAYKAENHAFTGALYVKNQPGANFIGSNYVSTPDSIYAVYQNRCHRLDIDTGETLTAFDLPVAPGEEQPNRWGYVGIWNDYLVAGGAPQMFDAGRIGEKNWNATSSQRVVVMNRYTGEVLWSRDAVYGFRHNAIVPVADKLFLIDRLSDGALKLLARRGLAPDDRPQLTALDLKTGQELWNTTDNIFGTWLSFSEEHDVLVQAGRTGGRESLSDEPNDRIIAYQGTSGSVLWDEAIRYVGPLVIHGDQLISSQSKQGAVGLLTGKPNSRLHPITGKELPWLHSRTYGCGTMLACENLLTFRSGAAGFYDLGNDGGTGNFGGFRASCTPNLVPADGVLNAPDYTRTCSCSYQNQTSLALVHQADVEIWTYSALPAPGEGEAVQRVGINFGAPGDRLADDGTLWLDYPSVGGSSPDLPLRIQDAAVQWYRHHSSLLDPETAATSTAADSAHVTLPWVAASGLEGAASIELTLESGGNSADKSYTLRLHFAEPRLLEPGQRVFDVRVQGKPVLSRFDIVQQAGGPRRPVVREFSGISVADTLKIELRSATGDGLAPLLSGIEVVRDP